MIRFLLVVASAKGDAWFGQGQFDMPKTQSAGFLQRTFTQNNGPSASADYLEVAKADWWAMVNAMPQDMKDTYPPLWESDVLQIENARVTARDAGQYWNKSVREKLDSGNNSPCVSMAAMRQFVWTKDEVYNKVMGGRASQVSHSLDQQREVDKWWNGQKELNEIWRSKACDGLTHKDITERCSSVTDAKEGFDTVCGGGSSSSSCFGCR